MFLRRRLQRKIRRFRVEIFGKFISSDKFSSSIQEADCKGCREFCSAQFVSAFSSVLVFRLWIFRVTLKVTLFFDSDESSILSFEFCVLTSCASRCNCVHIMNYARVYIKRLDQRLKFKLENLDNPKILSTKMILVKSKRPTSDCKPQRVGLTNFIGIIPSSLRIGHKFVIAPV